MSFENDDEFEDFLSEVQEDLKAYNQERADAGLASTPPAAGGGKPKDDEVINDKQLQELVDSF